MRRSRHLALAGAVVATIGLAGCGSDSDSDDRADGATGVVTVAANDTSCEVARTELAAGKLTFRVTNSGAKTTEFYIYAAGDRVVGEVENIAPGLTRELHVDLPAGTYETACKPGMSGKGIRGGLKVTGAAASAPTDAALTAAVENYRRYVQEQSTQLLTATGTFVTAVKAGDVTKAKELYPRTRTYWERIEPVAEIFGDLDPKIDGREDGLEPGAQFTGFHRLEKDLWTTGDLSKDGPVADQLLADVKEIVARATAERLTALQIANGAKALLDEVATGKITGEEERYSHTDLWDFAANVEGSKAAVDALRPVLTQRDPELLKALDAQFSAVNTVLGRHRSGDGWQPHTDLGQTELKELSDAINALAEPISRLAAVVAR